MVLLPLLRLRVNRIQESGDGIQKQTQTQIRRFRTPSPKHLVRTANPPRPAAGRCVAAWCIGPSGFQFARKQDDRLARTRPNSCVATGCIRSRSRWALRECAALRA